MLGVSTEEGEDCSRWKGRRQKKSMLEKSCWYFTETTALALAASFLLTNADNKLFPIRNICFWWTWTNEQLVTLVAVLSDKHKRTIYDTYGEKGLETEGLEVGQSSSSSPFESLECCLNLNPACLQEGHCFLQVLSAASQRFHQLCPLQPCLASKSVVGWAALKTVQGCGVLF